MWKRLSNPARSSLQWGMGSAMGKTPGKCSFCGDRSKSHLIFGNARRCHDECCWIYKILSDVFPLSGDHDPVHCVADRGGRYSGVELRYGCRAAADCRVTDRERLIRKDGRTGRLGFTDTPREPSLAIQDAHREQRHRPRCNRLAGSGCRTFGFACPPH
jgi:hypothetical protein